MLKSCKEEAGKMERFVLHVPSEHNFKGDPPHWARQLFLEPLIDGWKREVVIRTTPIKNKKADIYYFAPDGTKFRSRREVGQYFLDKGITKYSPVYNFWFCGKILGNEFAPYELVRGVHKKNEGGAGSSTSHLTAEDSPDDLLVTIPESEGKMVSDEEIEIDSEEEMVYDEEIEIDSSQVAVFDPAVLSSRSDPYEPMQLPIVRETYEPRWPGAVKSKEKAKSDDDADDDAFSIDENSYDDNV